MEVKKPANIIYGVDETPPLPVTIFNGIQHVGVVAINLVYPLLIFRVVDAPLDVVMNLLAAGMIVLGIATFLQARASGRLARDLCARLRLRPLIWRHRFLPPG
jgi:xanthine permease XanP